MNYSERIHNRLAALRADNSARAACTDIAAEADAEIARLRQALTSLMCHYPTDSDMIELDWEAGFIEAACKAHDNARAAVGAA